MSSQLTLDVSRPTEQGTISEWTCTYQLEDVEVSPLLDALGKNGSLTLLDLGASGIRFHGEDANGLPLVEKMSHSISALSSLERLRIRENGFYIPVSALRDPEIALAEIRKVPFFTPDGPRREEIIFMSDFLRPDKGEDAIADSESPRPPIHSPLPRRYKARPHRK